MSARYAWTDDRATFPALVVGRSYRHRFLVSVRIDGRIANERGCRYAFSVDGVTMGEQNDFALLNQLTDAPALERQLALL